MIDSKKIKDNFMLIIGLVIVVISLTLIDFFISQKDFPFAGGQKNPRPVKDGRGIKNRIRANM